MIERSLSRPLRVIVADDHPLVLEGIAGVLRSAGHTVVDTCLDGRELLQSVQHEEADVVTLDIGMPGNQGFEVARRVAELRPDLKIVILSQQTGPVYVRAAFQAGASGFVAKQSTSRDLLTALETIRRGQTYVTPGMLDEGRADVTPGSGSTRKASGLTERQRDVLQLIAAGKSAKEVAVTLGISVKTVEFHKQALMRSLNLRTTAALTRYAVAEGLCSL